MQDDLDGAVATVRVFLFLYAFSMCCAKTARTANLLICIGLFMTPLSPRWACAYFMCSVPAV